MTVEIKGVYLKALELMVKDYNEDTIKRWDKGEDIYLRKKESPETFINFVIMSFCKEYHSEVYDDLIKELELKAGLKKHTGDVVEHETKEKQTEHIEALTEITELYEKGSQFVSSKYYRKQDNKE